jgi:hypothetical protein
MPLPKLPQSGGFLSNAAELNAPIMFLQLSVEADMSEENSAGARHAKFT